MVRKPSFHQQREHMVERQILARGVDDPRTLDAMRTVPRECFVPRDQQHLAYDDGPISIGEGQTISQPFIVAVMIEALEPEPDDRVLEVGAGSGYAAAILSHMVREVVTIERLPALAQRAQNNIRRCRCDNVTVLCADGTRGWPAKAPYDAILVSAGAPPSVPESLREQLAIGGCLVIPVGRHQRSQQLMRIRRVSESRYEEEVIDKVQFVPLVGAEGWPNEPGG